jgi:hypothetical protein
MSLKDMDKKGVTFASINGMATSGKISMCGGDTQTH